jgi:predicted nucleotidyltransferase
MMSHVAVYKESFRRRQARLRAERERLCQETLAALMPKLEAIGARHAAEISRLLVFGSLLHPERFTRNSDIDVAVDWRRKGDYFALWREMEEALGREIDFRELGDDAFSQRVRAQGLVVYGS